MSDRYDALMARRERLHDAWMVLVGAAKLQGKTTQDFNSTGQILRRNGTLRMDVTRNGVRDMDLSVSLDGTVTATVRRPDGTYQEQMLMEAMR